MGEMHLCKAFMLYKKKIQSLPGGVWERVYSANSWQTAADFFEVKYLCLMEML
jgi:hypothetical protein